MLYNRISNLNPIMECTQHLAAARDKVKMVSGVRSHLIGDIRQFFNHILLVMFQVILTMDPSSMESKLITVTWNWTRVGFPGSWTFIFVVSKCHPKMRGYICFYLFWLWPRLFDLNLKHCLIKLPQRKMQLVSYVLQRSFVRFLSVMKYL